MTHITYHVSCITHHASRIILLSLISTSIVLLSACRNTPIPPAPQNPVAAAEPTATTQIATPTLAPTKPHTSSPPTPDSLLPTPTLPPPAIATATAKPSPTPTPSPSPTNTPEPVTLLTKEDFGDDRNPFTGELVEDPAVLQRRPIACKISNHPPEYTRPQSGLNDADLLFEHINQWINTRFTAIFYSKSPPAIGPVRSYRLIDFDLLAMYDAYLCTSGAAPGIEELFWSSDVRGKIIGTGSAGFYRTEEEDKPYEHTFYADPEGLWRSLDERERNVAPELRNNMHFATEPPAGGQPATDITVRFYEDVVDWHYDPENGRYWRETDGEIHRDANTGEQLNVRNVVVLFAVHYTHEEICAEWNDEGECIANTVIIELNDSGRAIVFRDGLMVEGTWRRPNHYDMFTFYDADDNPIPLQLGNTLFEILTAHRENQVSTEP